jgi:hypothetical protein
MPSLYRQEAEMKAAKLQVLLNQVGVGIDIVIGGRDTGIYFEPTIAEARLVTMWKLVQENPAGGPNYVTYFKDKAVGERDRLNSSLPSLAFHEVECMCI